MTASMLHRSLRADQLGQGNIWKKPLYGESSHRDQHFGLHDSQLGLEPIRAARLLVVIRNAISSSAWVWSGITARDGGDVNHFSRGRLVHARAAEPTKERPTRAAGEGHSTLCLYLPGRLPHEHRTWVGSPRNDGSNASA